MGVEGRYESLSDSNGAILALEELKRSPSVPPVGRRAIGETAGAAHPRSPGRVEEVHYGLSWRSFAW